MSRQRPSDPDEKEYLEGNYVVSFEGEITVEAETQVKAENQGYDLLSHLGQITVVAFKKRKSRLDRNSSFLGRKTKPVGLKPRHFWY